MYQMTRFFAMNSADRRTLCAAVAWLIVIRVGLLVIPFRALRALVLRLSRAPSNSRRNLSPGQNKWVCISRGIRAIETGGRHLPGCRNCLCQALAAKILLARRGCPTGLRIGVAHSRSGNFEAHAWLVAQDQVLIGGRVNLADYTPLPPLEEENSHENRDRHHESDPFGN